MFFYNHISPSLLCELELIQNGHFYLVCGVYILPKKSNGWILVDN